MTRALYTSVYLVFIAHTDLGHLLIWLVYNSTEIDQVRIVSISPSERWGGEGVLGAEVAHGYLHRLPSSTRNTIGTSVGFVNLSKDATAATDAFSK